MLPEIFPAYFHVTFYFSIPFFSNLPESSYTRTMAVATAESGFGRTGASPCREEAQHRENFASL
jgi:hypothetical protein